MKRFHLRFTENHWELTEADYGAFAAFPTKDEAIGKVLNLLLDTPGSLEIHRRDGSVEEEWAISLPG